MPIHARASLIINFKRIIINRVKSIVMNPVKTAHAAAGLKRMLDGRINLADALGIRRSERVPASLQSV